MTRFAVPLLLILATACGGDSPASPADPTPPPPPTLVTVFDGSIAGATQGEVEAACKATPLPSATNSYYVIRQLERIVLSRAFSNPWPGRVNGDIHARESVTSGKLRFACLPKNRDGSSGTEFVVELGQELGPIVTADVKVCEPDPTTLSKATAINTGQLKCPYDFGGAIFTPTSDFLAAGPFPTVEAIEGPTCTIFRPQTLGENGRRHPVILWANGITLAPNWYRGLLTHFASHGFVVAATDTSRVGSAGTGENLLGCLAYLEAQGALAGGVYENKLNLYRVGVTGHSAGGAGVIMAGRDPRITATAPIQPWVGLTHGYDPVSATQQNGPMFLSSGELDTQVPFAHPQGVYSATAKPIFWGHRLGSGHNDALFDAPLYRRPLTAWFRWHLMLDVNARGLFYGTNCQLCQATGWVVQRKNGIS